ncbi:MAG: PAS domain S-box protein [Nitrospirae bacterium]|nr:MAG: PAS domain S-box protein [Nitrospirota bacterium]
MQDIQKLNEAFRSFNRASDILSSYFSALKREAERLGSELQRKNEELERTLSFLDSVLQSIGEGVIVLDREGKILFLNETACELTGLDLTNSVGKDISDLQINWLLKEQETVIQLNGKKRYITVSVSGVFRESAENIGRIIMIRDVTKRREMEVERERNRRLIAMGEMMATIVHELRNPLCSIELYASMLYRELTDTDLCSLAEGVSTGVQNLNNFLTNMLYFAKPRSPKLSETNLAGLVEEALGMVAPVVSSRGIRVQNRVLSGIIRIDRGLILQVLMNILLNAIQVMQKGGSITIEDEETEDAHIVHITDTGPGIPEDEFDRVFDPFYTTRDGGTGLGLPISLKIMQAHGGSIRIRSEVGKGSRFSLIFPLHRNCSGNGDTISSQFRDKEEAFI